MLSLNDPTLRGSAVATAAIAVLAFILAMLPSPSPEVTGHEAADLAAPSAAQTAATPKTSSPPASSPTLDETALAKIAAGFLTHQAYYKTSLSRAEPSSNVSGAEGGLLYHFADACDGWISDYQSLLSISYGEEDAVESSWTYSSWESKDGLRYRFSLRETRGDVVVSTTEGSAEFEFIGGPGVARLTEPEPREIPLAAGTLFPTHHMAAMLLAAETGQTHFYSALFDGVSDTDVQAVNALFGEAVRESLSAAHGEALAEAITRQIALAYYPVGSQDQEPDFEIFLRLRNDGATAHFVQDFGDFTLDGQLQKIELPPKPGC